MTSDEFSRIHYRLACVVMMGGYGTLLNEIYTVVRTIIISIVDGYIN